MGSWGEQFSTGDQSRTNREALWMSDFKKCPSCGECKIINNVVSAGCRHNGDGYGTETFECSNCHWLTSFQYDEAGDIYYYETRFWRSDPTPPAPKAIPLLDDDNIRKYSNLFHVVGRERTFHAMSIAGFSTAVIDDFISGLEKK